MHGARRINAHAVHLYMGIIKDVMNTHTWSRAITITYMNKHFRYAHIDLHHLTNN